MLRIDRRATGVTRELNMIARRFGGIPAVAHT
jgi:hypothetical protein